MAGGRINTDATFLYMNQLINIIIENFLTSASGSEITGLTISAEISIGKDQKPALKLIVSDNGIRQKLVDHINSIAHGFNNSPIKYSQDEYIILGMQRLANIIKKLAPTIEISETALQQHYSRNRTLGQFSYQGKPDIQLIIDTIIQHFIAAYNQANTHHQIAAFTVLAQISIGNSDKKPALQLHVSDEAIRQSLVGFLNSVASGHGNRPIRFSKDNYLILGQERLANIINQLDNTIGLTSDSFQKYYTVAEDLGPSNYATETVTETYQSPTATVATQIPAQFFYSNGNAPRRTHASIESLLIDILRQQTAGLGWVATEGNSTWFQNQLSAILGKDALNDLKEGSILSDVPEKLKNSSLEHLLETRSDYLHEKGALTDENKKELGFIKSALDIISPAATPRHT